MNRIHSSDSHLTPSASTRPATFQKPSSDEATFRDFCSVTEYFTFKDSGILFVGLFLACLTGGGIPHLVCVVGWMLDVFVLVNPFTEEFRTKITPLLLYFSSAALVLAVVAFLQYVCFRLIALKIGRRIRRAYFRGILNQKLEYFNDPKNENLNSSFEMDMEKCLSALTDALPTMINSISQIIVSCLISFYFSWRLSWPIACMGVVAFLWILVFTAFGMSATRKEAEMLSKTFQSLTSSLSYREFCNKQYSIGIRRAAFFGIVAGSMQLFLFAGMGLSALYGNWLIDEGLLSYPGLIFVIACSIIPAACRLGQIHSNWVSFVALKFACKHVHRARDIQSIGSIFSEGDIPPPDYWTTVAYKRKQFLITFFKNELNIEEDSFHPRNSSAFKKLRSSAFSKWKIYGLGFIFCLIFAAGPPTFTYLNGNLYEFYKPHKTTFFKDGISISWKYLTAGVVACIGGILGTILFARNGELIAWEIRKDVYSDCIQRHGAAFTDSIRGAIIPLLTKSANNCKGAFDARLSQFSVGVFTLAFGIAYVFEKNLVSAFLCSVCFVIQAINQYVVFRIAHIHTKRAMAEKNEKGKIALTAFEQINEIEISTSVETIEARHDSYLSYSFEKHSSIIPIQALRYAFIIAIPQVTQVLAYVIGCYLVMEDLVRPVVIYKVVQTLYMSAFSISTIAQYNADVDKARLGALSLKDIITDEDVEGCESPRTDRQVIAFNEIL